MFHRDAAANWWNQNCTTGHKMWCHVLFDPLNAQLNYICPLLALFGAHHILHVSRKRVKHGILYTLRRRRVSSIIAVGAVTVRPSVGACVRHAAYAKQREHTHTHTHTTKQCTQKSFVSEMKTPKI